MKRKQAVFISVLALLGALAIGAGSADAAVYDFNSLNGSDNDPFSNPNGQDNWKSTGFIFNSLIPSWYVGVTQSLGFDGTQALRFQRVGAGYGADASRLNDPAFSFPTFSGSETQAFFQVDFGVGYWGADFALAYDANNDGVILKTGPGEIGPRLRIGSLLDVGVQVISASAGSTFVPISAVNGEGGHWIRLLLVMDFTANGGQGSSDVYYQNLTLGDLTLQPVAGLQDVNLGLNPLTADARNPTLWNAMWTHMEGATYQLDNISIGGLQVPMDIKPGSCPNPLNVKSRGVLPVAIAGTADFDVTQVDLNTLNLEGVAPLRWSYEDVATPFVPFGGKSDCFADCQTAGADGVTDLVLHFDTQEIVAALGEVEDGECLILELFGDLMDGTSFVGEDVVIVKNKGKK